MKLNKHYRLRIRVAFYRKSVLSLFKPNLELQPSIVFTHIELHMALSFLPLTKTCSSKVCELNRLGHIFNRMRRLLQREKIHFRLAILQACLFGTIILLCNMVGKFELAFSSLGWLITTLNHILCICMVLFEASLKYLLTVCIRECNKHYDLIILLICKLM